MNLYEKVLKDFFFNVIIWEKVEDSLICTFSKNKMINIKEKTSHRDYLKSNSQLKNIYEQLLLTNKEQTIVIGNDEITVYHLEDKCYYEIRTTVKTIYDYTLLSNISSQIRDPLTNMMGATNSLSESSLTKQQKQSIVMIEKSVYDVLSLTNDIIDIVNLKHNKIKLNSEFIKLSTCIDDVFDVIKSRVYSKKISIVSKVDPNVPDVIKTDKKRLTQLLINILTFSIKNISNGHIMLNISILKSSKEIPFEFSEIKKPKVNLLFKIRDVSELSTDTIKYLETIFDIKNHQDIKTYNSCEFGLIISKYLCNLMGGHIWFKDATEFGTTYCFNTVCDAKI